METQCHSGSHAHRQSWLFQNALVAHLIVLAAVGVAHVDGQTYLQSLVSQIGAVTPDLQSICGTSEVGANGHLVAGGSPLNHWQVGSTQVDSSFMVVHLEKSAALSGITLGTQKSLSEMNSFPVDHWHLAWLQASLEAAVMHCPTCCSQLSVVGGWQKLAPKRSAPLIRSLLAATSFPFLHLHCPVHSAWAA